MCLVNYMQWVKYNTKQIQHTVQNKKSPSNRNFRSDVEITEGKRKQELQSNQVIKYQMLWLQTTLWHIQHVDSPTNKIKYPNNSRILNTLVNVYNIVHIGKEFNIDL